MERGVMVNSGAKRINGTNERTNERQRHHHHGQRRKRGIASAVTSFGKSIYELFLWNEWTEWNDRGVLRMDRTRRIE